MKFKLFFAWYDFWIGWYYDRAGTLYICPLPMICLMISWVRQPLHPTVGEFADMIKRLKNRPTYKYVETYQTEGDSCIDVNKCNNNQKGQTYAQDKQMLEDARKRLGGE